jgi:hypothetical protein
MEVLKRNGKPKLKAKATMLQTTLLTERDKELNELR